METGVEVISASDLEEKRRISVAKALEYTPFRDTKISFKDSKIKKPQLTKFSIFIIFLMVGHF